MNHTEIFALKQICENWRVRAAESDAYLEEWKKREAKIGRTYDGEFDIPAMSPAEVKDLLLIRESIVRHFCDSTAYKNAQNALEALITAAEKDARNGL